MQGPLLGRAPRHHCSTPQHSMAQHSTAQHGTAQQHIATQHNKSWHSTAAYLDEHEVGGQGVEAVLADLAGGQLLEDAAAQAAALHLLQHQRRRDRYM